MAESLRGCCDLLASDLERPYDRGSPAFQETSAEILAGGLGKHPSQAAVTVASGLVASGVDHARAMCALLEAERVVYSIATVARGAIEALGQAEYLLSAADPRDRVRRHLNLRLHDLFQQLGAAGVMPAGPDRDKALKDGRRRREDLLQAAERSGFRVVDRKDSRRSAQLHPPRPPMNRLCGEVMDPGGTGLGPATYGYYSLMAHSHQSSLTQDMVPQIANLDPDYLGIVTTELTVSVESIARRFLPVTIALARVSEHHYALMGWQTAGRRAALSMTRHVWLDAANLPA